MVGRSLNQPTFGVCATWNPNAITFANNSTVGRSPEAVFVDIHNSVHVGTNWSLVQIWDIENTTLSRSISTTYDQVMSIFVNINGDIYSSSNNVTNSLVKKWLMNGSSSSIIVMHNAYQCYSIFIDIYDSIYCSMSILNQVRKRSVPR